MPPWSPSVFEALISVKADKSYRAEIGDTVHIHVPVDHCHLFDAQSGERIGLRPMMP